MKFFVAGNRYLLNYFNILPWKAKENIFLTDSFLTFLLEQVNVKFD